MTYIYLDIETIGAQSEEAKARIASTVKPPSSMKKPETIAAWERDQKADAVKEAIEKSSFNAAYGQICCIGWAIDSGETDAVTLTSDQSEKSIIEAFFNHIDFEIDDRPSNSKITIVGHYITGFDIRFIIQRCIVLGIRIPLWFPRDPKPWSNDVFDTMTAWAGAKDSISMDNLCAALGLEGKGDVDGSMVAQMFAEGKHAEIAQYCREDIERTRAIHRKMMVAFGG
jgi:DNA polymerase elongation subunit (family B)